MQLVTNTVLEFFAHIHAYCLKHVFFIAARPCHCCVWPEVHKSVVVSNFPVTPRLSSPAQLCFLAFCIVQIIAQRHDLVQVVES